MKKLLVLAGVVPLAVVGITGVAGAASSSVVRPGDLQAYSNAAGDAGFQFLSNGLQMHNGDGDSYARLRWNVGLPVSQLTSASFDWAGTTYKSGTYTGPPALRYDIDADGDGSVDCELVGEEIYGSTYAWLNKDANTPDSVTATSNQDDGSCASKAPTHDAAGPGGLGQGDLKDWTFGTAAVLKWGGVVVSDRVSDGVLKSVTFGDRTYTFSSSSASVAGPQASDVTGKLIAKQRVHAVEMRFESDQLPAGRVQGAPLRWSVTVNGVKRSTYTLNAGQSASDRVVNHKRRGYKVVRVYKNGTKVATYVVAPRKRH